MFQMISGIFQRGLYSPVQSGPGKPGLCGLVSLRSRDPETESCGSTLLLVGRLGGPGKRVVEVVVYHPSSKSG